MYESCVCEEGQADPMDLFVEGELERVAEVHGLSLSKRVYIQRRRTEGRNSKKRGRAA